MMKLSSYVLALGLVLGLFACVFSSNATADEVVFGGDITGEFEDGTMWTETNSSSVTVKATDVIASLDGSLKWYIDDWNLVFNVTTGMSEYLHFEWWYEDSRIGEWWPSTSNPHTDIGYQYVDIEYDVSDWSSSEDWDFNFDRGYGHYNLTVIYTFSSTTGYYLTNSTSVHFTYVNPSTVASDPAVLIFGATGMLMMALAIPVGIFFFKQSMWISGLGAVFFMFILGYGVFVGFVLNGGGF